MKSGSNIRDSQSFCKANSDLLEKAALRRFYSRERIVTWKAKHEFVPPDLESLPLRRGTQPGATAGAD